MSLFVRWSFLRGMLGLRGWASWLHEDLGARLHHWLRADFVPPSPFLVIQDKEAKSSRIWSTPPYDAWMPYLCRSGHPVVTVE